MIFLFWRLPFDNIFDISTCQSHPLTPDKIFDFNFGISLTIDVKAIVKGEVMDVKEFHEIFWRNESVDILSFDILKYTPSLEHTVLYSNALSFEIL